MRRCALNIPMTHINLSQRLDDRVRGTKDQICFLWQIFLSSDPFWSGRALICAAVPTATPLQLPLTALPVTLTDSPACVLQREVAVPVAKL